MRAPVSIVLTAVLAVAICRQDAVAADDGYDACLRQTNGAVVDWRAIVLAELKQSNQVRLLAPFDGWSALMAELGLVVYRLLPPPQRADSGEGVVRITTAFPGADLEAVAAMITVPLEQAIAQAPGIQAIESITRDGSSQIAARFDSADAAARTAVRDAIGGMLSRLPSQADMPSIVTVRGNAGSRIELTLGGDRLSIDDLTRLAEADLTARLQEAPGVAQVEVLGERRPVLRLAVDPQRLSAFGMTVQDIAVTLGSMATAGPVARTGALEWTLDSGAVADPSVVLDLVVKTIDGAPVPLSALASLEQALDDDGTIVRSDLRPALGLRVVPASATSIAADVCRTLAEIRPTLPPGTSIRMLGALGLR